MERTDLMDTTPEMYELRVKLLREKGPEWRLRKALELSEELKEIKKAAKRWREQNQP